MRGLGRLGRRLITIGSIVGTGIFLTTADMARVLPHPGLILLVWVLGGLFTLAGALTYAELGGACSRARAASTTSSRRPRRRLGLPLRLGRASW